MSQARRSMMSTRPESGAAVMAGAVIVLAAALTTAQDAPPAERTAAAEPAVTRLFDGTSLVGWKKSDMYGSGTVEVKDGAILLLDAGSFGGMTGVTTTRKDLSKLNYELSYEAKRIKGSDFFAAATFPVGDSFITLVNGGWGGSVTGLSSLDGADASENDSSAYFEYEDDTWYRFRVQVTGERIRCWIDDKALVNVEHAGRGVSTRLETYPSQPLGFATWETSGAIRGVTLRALTPEEVAKANEAK